MTGTVTHETTPGHKMSSKLIRDYYHFYLNVTGIIFINFKTIIIKSSRRNNSDVVNERSFNLKGVVMLHVLHNSQLLNLSDKPLVNQLDLLRSVKYMVGTGSNLTTYIIFLLRFFFILETQILNKVN